MGIGLNIIGIAIIFVVGFIFYAEISDGVSGIFSDAQLQAQNDALDIKPDAQTQAVCDLAITFKGEIEHDLFAGFFESAGLDAELRWEFGDNTFFPQVAEWQFINCQGGNFQIASFIPRIPTEIEIIQQGGAVNEDLELTTNQLISIGITDLQTLSLSGDAEQVFEQLQDLNVSVDDLQTNAITPFWDESFQMKLKIREADNPVKFRECNSFNQDLCKEIVIKAGIIQTPLAFEKTFLITNLPLEEYIIEIVIEQERINNLQTNEPFIYNVRFN